MSEAVKVYTFEYELEDFETKEKLDSNKGEPLSIVAGAGTIIKGLEDEIVNMQVGESKQIVVKPEDGYGVYNDTLVETHPADNFKGIELSKGMVLYGNTEDGQTVQVMVKDFNSENVMVDFNHPFAGKILAFDMKITGIREATEEEAASGQIKSEGDSCCGSGCGCH